MTMKLSLATLVAFFALIVSATSAHAGLLAYYPFDNDFNDASGNNNHLTVVTGMPTISNTADEYVYGGGALDADSTTSNEEYLALTNPITFGASDPWSVAFWVGRRPGTDDRSGMVIGNADNNADFIWVSMGHHEGLRFRNSGSTDAAEYPFNDDNQWQHWVVIADGAGNVEGYRDNNYLGSVANITTFSISHVAQAYANTIQSMDGQIDELYIFDHAIDTTAVANLHNNVPEPATFALLGLGGLVAIYRRSR